MYRARRAGKIREVAPWLREMASLALQASESLLAMKQGIKTGKEANSEPSQPEGECVSQQPFEPLIDANEAGRILKLHPVTVREMAGKRDSRAQNRKGLALPGVIVRQVG